MGLQLVVADIILPVFDLLSGRAFSRPRVAQEIESQSTPVHPVETDEDVHEIFGQSSADFFVREEDLLLVFHRRDRNLPVDPFHHVEGPAHHEGLGLEPENLRTFHVGRHEGFQDAEFLLHIVVADQSDKGFLPDDEFAGAVRKGEAHPEGLARPALGILDKLGERKSRIVEVLPEKFLEVFLQVHGLNILQNLLRRV